MYQRHPMSLAQVGKNPLCLCLWQRGQWCQFLVPWPDKSKLPTSHDPQPPHSTSHEGDLGPRPGCRKSQVHPATAGPKSVFLKGICRTGSRGQRRRCLCYILLVQVWSHSASPEHHQDCFLSTEAGIGTEHCWVWPKNRKRKKKRKKCVIV